MKTKKVKMLWALTVVGFTMPSAFAQSNYFQVNAGYSFKMASQTMLFTSNEIDQDSYKVKSGHISFGKGINGGLAFGHMFNNNVGAELGVSYLLGGKSVFKEKMMSDKEEIVLTGKMFRVVPSLVIMSGMEKMNPYAKMGLIMGFGSIKSKATQNNGTDETIQEAKLNGGMGWGFSTSFGVQYLLGSSTCLFAEFNVISMSYAPTKGKMTKYTENGVDQLAGMTTYQKETEYSNEITVDTNTPVNDSEPDQDLKEKLPFSSMGINIGWRMNF